MNGTTWTIYREYLDKTGSETVAASLALADVLQSTLDAKDETPAPTMPEGMLNLVQAAAYLGSTAHGLRKVVIRTQQSRAGQPIKGPTIEFFQQRKGSTILFRREWLDAFIEAHRILPGTPALPKVREKSLRPGSPNDLQRKTLDWMPRRG